MGLARRFIPSPAMAVALLALFVALGGVSYGIATNSIGSSQIANNSIRGKDIRNNTVASADLRNSGVTGKDVKNNSLTGADVNESKLGPISPRGAAGGSLSGSFPNPGIAAGAVGASQIADGAVGPRQHAPIPGVHAGGVPGVMVPTATSTRLPFTALPFIFDYDTDNMHDRTGPNPERITAHTAGVYVVNAVVSWGINPTGARSLRLEEVRGTSSQSSVVVSGPGSAAGVTQNLATTVRMQVGDYVDVVGIQDSGATLSVFPIWFGADWIGP